MVWIWRFYKFSSWKYTFRDLAIYYAKYGSFSELFLKGTLPLWKIIRNVKYYVPSTAKHSICVNYHNYHIVEKFYKGSPAIISMEQTRNLRLREFKEKNTQVRSGVWKKVFWRPKHILLFLYETQWLLPILLSTGATKKTEDPKIFKKYGLVGKMVSNFIMARV